MKKICFLFLIMAATQALAQNKDYLISMEGLGALKLGMTQAQIEKLVNQKFVLDNHLDTINDSYWDTAKIKYKGINVQLEFSRSYYAPNVFHMRLIGIRASSPLCKTASGIGIGSDQLKIIMAYPNNSIIIQPGYVSYFETEKGKGKSTISIKDDSMQGLEASNAYMIRLYLLNKKVVSFELKAELMDERTIPEE
jgi:hypothetical protein